MTTQCIHCGTDAPADVWRCTRCGKTLRPVSPPPLDWRPGLSGATTRPANDAEAVSLAVPVSPVPPTPTTQDNVPTACFNKHQIVTSLIGLLFAAAFTVSISEFVHHGGVPTLGVWPMGVLALGGLLAQQAWVKGDAWRGLRGMGLWGGMTWLLATGNILPWTLVLLGAWLALLPFPLRRH